jgi:hypothetical protein
VTARGKEAAALALHRFGFGPARDLISAIAGDPRGALLSDLDRPGAGYLAAKLPSSGAAARAISDFRAEEQAKSKLAQRAKKEAEAANASANFDCRKAPSATLCAAPPVQNDAGNQQPPQPPQTPLPQQIFQNEATARYDTAVGADIGFVERLVWFWSNHFCISADKDIAMVGAYEREAIRAHVLGGFGDMLAAVESHPAMLYYLDNVRSMGANSIAGINGDKGRTRISRARFWSCTRSVFAAAIRKLTSRASPMCSPAGHRPTRPIPRMAVSFSSTSACTSRASRPCSASFTPKVESIRAAPCSPTWRVIRQRRNTSRKNSPVTLSPTSRRHRWSPSSPKRSRTVMETSRPWPRLW